jgi:hypothetical protein
VIAVRNFVALLVRKLLSKHSIVLQTMPVWHF